MKPANFLVLALFLSCTRESAFQNEVVKLQVELTNVSHPLLKSASLKVDEIRLNATKDGKAETMIIGKNTGYIQFDDLEVSSGFKISDLLVGSGMDVKSLVLVLNREGNYLVKKNDTKCEHVPSAKLTEIEIKIPQKMKLVPGHDYTMTLDFDAPESIYLMAGDCHFTPKIVMRPIQRSIASIDLGPDLKTQKGEEQVLAQEDPELYE